MRDGGGKPAQKLLPNPLIGPKRQIEKPKHTPYAGGVHRSFVTTKEETYYRVYSGDSKIGRFMTKIKPKNSTVAQNSLSLPEWNKAEYIQPVLVPAGNRLQRSRALPAYGKRGGAEQFQILEADLNKAGIIYGEGVPFK